MSRLPTIKEFFLNKIAEIYVSGTIPASTAVSMIQDPDDLDILLKIIDCRMRATTNLMKAMLTEASTKIRSEKREAFENWVSAGGPEPCHKAIDDF